MPTPASLSRIRALEILADGEWHDYRSTVREVAFSVPPGVAMRRANRGRAASGKPRKKDPDNHTRQIEIGASSIAREVLMDETTFEIEPRGRRTYHGPKRVRLVPAKVPPAQGDEL